MYWFLVYMIVSSHFRLNWILLVLKIYEKLILLQFVYVKCILYSILSILCVMYSVSRHREGYWWGSRSLCVRTAVRVASSWGCLVIWVSVTDGVERAVQLLWGLSVCDISMCECQDGMSPGCFVLCHFGVVTAGWLRILQVCLWWS